MRGGRKARIVGAIHQDVAPAEHEAILAGEQTARGQHRAGGSIKMLLANRLDGYPRVLCRKGRAPLLDLLGKMARDYDKFAHTGFDHAPDDVGNEWFPSNLEQGFRPVCSQRAQPGTSPRCQQNRFARHHVPKHSSATNALLACRNFLG